MLLYAAAFLLISKSRDKYLMMIIKEAAAGKLNQTEELVTEMRRSMVSSTSWKENNRKLQATRYIEHSSLLTNTEHENGILVVL